MALRILTHPAAHSAALLTAGGSLPSCICALSDATERISVEIDCGFRIADIGLFGEIQLPNRADCNVEIAAAQDLWDAGALLKLYRSHVWVSELVDAALGILTVCLSQDIWAEAQLDILKKKINSLILSVSHASKNSRPVISGYLREAAEAARPLRKTSDKELKLSRLIAEEALFELKLIHRSLIYQIKDNKKHLESRSAMRENRLALISGRSITPSKLKRFAKSFRKPVAKNSFKP
jgi:hypothetical protein